MIINDWQGKEVVTVKNESYIKFLQESYKNKHSINTAQPICKPLKRVENGIEFDRRLREQPPKQTEKYFI